ncbi:MAG: iron-sulfur cluster carrier protein ApbC [Calditrichaeota bacterium]|nr:MAG: iron-sulfur cluster carrier protein ApbC [Calditrichota bacterium]
MATVSDKDVLQALGKVEDPMSGKDIVSINMIKDVRVDDSRVSFTIEFKSETSPHREEIVKQAKAVVKGLPGVEEVTVNTGVHNPLKVVSTPSSQSPPPRPQQPMPPPQANLAPNARHIIAVASGKGGVGKTTVSVNLAIALAQTGAKVGLLDADIYGPNVPIMMGVESKLGTRNNKIAPLRRYDVDMVSVGFIAEGDTAIIWRGPLVGRMIQQFLQDVDWGELDYLIVDLPPGTGDAQLTLTQSVPLTGAIVVSTPQDVALSDAKKGINMFKKVEVPVLGVVENMSYFVCPHCQGRTEIFDHGGGKKASKKFDVPFLGEIPLDIKIRIGGDQGKPIVVSEPDSPVSEAFKKLAESIIAQVSKKDQGEGVFKRVFKIS